jgi:hypothetical protein
MIWDIPEHFCEVLDSGVRFVRDIFERIMSLNQATANDAENIE